MVALVLGGTAFPFLVGAWMAVCSRCISAILARRVTVVTSGLTALCALLLLPHIDRTLAIEIEWLPGTGPMSLGLGATGLFAAVATTWAAFFAQLAGPRHTAIRSPWSGALTLVALAGANVAFLSEHFLGRYVALEVAALCVTLAPLVELGGSEGKRDATGGRLSTAVYLILRLGDAGLLVAILILMSAGGTLDIASALEAGRMLDPAHLGWVVVGFLLAVWVKMGVWPFHLWAQAGQRLSFDSRAWLYAIVMPNLGAYLLYRVTPLLALAEPLRTITLWLGAGSAALAMLVALTRPGEASQANLHSELVYLGAAQGGLALFVAASGIKPVVWLGLLAVTPLRLMLFWTADAAEATDSRAWRRIAASLFGLGGAATMAFALLTTWWTRETSTRSLALSMAEVASWLMVAWAVRSTWRLLSTPQGIPEPRFPKSRPGIHWARWATMGVLACGMLAGGLAWEPLIRHLSAVSHMSLPTLHTQGRFATAAPSLLATLVITGGMWLRQRWNRQRYRQPEGNPPALSGQTEYGLGEDLARAARALQAVGAFGIQERILALVVRAAIDGTQWTYRIVEKRLLEDSLHGLAQVVVGAGRITYRIVEHEGLEGVLRRTARAILALSRGLQRLHTGRLRHNVLWVAASLILAVLALTLCGQR